MPQVVRICCRWYKWCGAELTMASQDGGAPLTFLHPTAVGLSLNWRSRMSEMNLSLGASRRSLNLQSAPLSTPPALFGLAPFPNRVDWTARNSVTPSTRYIGTVQHHRRSPITPPQSANTTYEACLHDQEKCTGYVKIRNTLTTMEVEYKWIELQNPWLAGYAICCR